MNSANGTALINVLATGLANRTFLISGGSRGIGENVALELARIGASVAIAGRNGLAVEEAVGRLRAQSLAPDRILGITADVASAADIERMVHSAHSHFGALDVLVNCAGINIRTPALEVTESEWDSVMNVNLRGAFFTSQAFARALGANGMGKIINVSSQYGHVGSPTRVAYCSSKGGLELMTKTLAVEWAPRILVNSVCPTFIETGLTQSLLAQPETRRSLLDRIPMHRFGTLGDVTGAILYLASDWSNMVTGTAMMVDGGWTAS